MRHAVLLYSGPTDFADMTEAGRNAMRKICAAYVSPLKEAGVFVADGDTNVEGSNR